MPRFLFALSLVAFAAAGQDFEVATVKPAAGEGPPNVPAMILKSPSADLIRFAGGPGTKNPNRIDYLGVTLKSLLQRAYDVRANQVSGPGWIETERYDIVATLPPGTDAAGLRVMLQRLIADRFQLRSHRETKSLPVYLLTVGRGGPKLAPEEKEPSGPEEIQAWMKARVEKSTQEMRARQESGDRTPRSGMSDTSATMQKLADALTRVTDRPVLDRTSLADKFSYNLSYVPDGSATAGSSGPSIYAAVEEQLGLKLQPANEPLEVIVVDQALRTPTDN